MRALTSLLVIILSVTLAIARPNVLFLTKSQGFEHSVVRRRSPGQLSLVEQLMKDLEDKYDYSVTCTKHASNINADNLKDYDVVMFYTSGDLTQASDDGGDAMSESGIEELLEWIRSGKGFVGVHSATDTFHESLPYIEMIGGKFEWHGDQQEATVTKLADHPTIDHLEPNWRIMEEWYELSEFNRTGKLIPLLLLQSEDMNEERYTSKEPYPIAYLQDYGSGRVFYNAMGHRRDTWENPLFQEMVVKAIHWAATPEKEPEDTTEQSDETSKPDNTEPEDPTPSNTENEPTPSNTEEENEDTTPSETEKEEDTTSDEVETEKPDTNTRGNSGQTDSGDTKETPDTTFENADPSPPSTINESSATVAQLSYFVLFLKAIYLILQ